MALTDLFLKLGLKKLDRENALCNLIVGWFREGEEIKAFTTALFVKKEMNEAIRKMDELKMQELKRRGKLKQ